MDKDGLPRYCGPLPIVLFARPIDGLVFGVASLFGAGVWTFRRGEDGLGSDSRLPVGRSAGLAARAPGPMLWLKFGFGSEGMGVRPP
jgi:hypothetical protein